MAIVIPMSRIYGEVKANLINNNAIDNVQFDIDRQVIRNTIIPYAEWMYIVYSKRKKLYVVVGINSLSYSDDGVNFTIGEIPNGDWYGIAYSENKDIFVAIGRNQVAYSSDGKKFTLGSIPSWNWNNIVYAENKGMFVAVSSDGHSAYSTDGIIFRIGNIQEARWNGLTYAENKGMFVAVGYYSGVPSITGAISYSYNGIDFFIGAIPNVQWSGISYSESRKLFVVTSSEPNRAGYTASSVDGITFILGELGNIPAGHWRDVIYVEKFNLFIALSSFGTTALPTGNIAYSSDGKKFTLGSIPNALWNTLTYSVDNEKVIVVGASSSFATSIDGINYTYTVVSGEKTSRMIGIGNNPFLIQGNELLTTNTTYKDIQLGTIPMTQHIANKIISRRKNGLQSVKFTCDYKAKYFDENGNETKYTGTNGQLLSMNEEIILWDDRNGRNEPLLKKADGSARKFIITSNEFEFEGIALQNIDALEI